MGIYLNQYAIAQRNEQGEGFDRIKGLPLMTRAQADKAAKTARDNGFDVVVVNTKAE